MIKPIIVGNWKLNGSKKLIESFLKQLNQFLIKYYKICTVVIAPPVLYSHLIQNMFSSDKKNFFLGAQNIDIHFSGPFTGEISPIMLKDIGIKYVIIGHSERRLNHKETNEIIAKKFCMLKEENLVPILCIGETKKEKIDKKTKDICKKQIDIIFNMYGSNAFDNSIIAYEPIWSIGSGNSAAPKEVQCIAHFIRNYVKSKSNHNIENFFIQYGGSVTKNNAKELIYQKDIDGFLVGGASLQLEEFSKIIEITNI
ncbi:triose-phosphate isomerase [Buchnera aphidicola]|uniref:Triosephosphate isomerase n=1 Tax=Buchnera aphidicola subsp. Cinara cedri (strain Cc) TaxID=372461 RepID=TPIS_BUCCC|nr:triose-phosphate isomerase [Buchnera aphidicola]Q057N9.1 RecName: Full=Triosephosphate isomerase; Short=TIM; Short=TPI; AltName: Full=Triose-phosphate isomerase [Buchnera aphidicola BCc]ABJ90660.1 triose phosphate isomerase [Buchnera aphidicola BCc]